MGMYYKTPTNLPNRNDGMDVTTYGPSLTSKGRRIRAINFPKKRSRAKQYFGIATPNWVVKTPHFPDVRTAAMFGSGNSRPFANIPKCIFPAKWFEASKISPA